MGRALLLLGSGKGLTPVGLFWFQPIAGKGQHTLLLPGECLSSPCDLHQHQGEENLIFTWQGTALHWPSLTPPWWGVRGSLLQLKMGRSVGSSLDLCWCGWVHSSVCVRCLGTKLCLDWPFPDLLAMENRILFVFWGVIWAFWYFQFASFFNFKSGIFKAQKKTYRTHYYVVFLGSWDPYLVCLLSTFSVFLCLLYKMSKTLSFT